MMSAIKLNKRNLTFYIVLATSSLFFTLWLPYVGEEAVYTLSAYEMWYHHRYLLSSLYEVFYGRPPLFSWLIIPLSHIIGWSNVLIASRLVSAISISLIVLGIFLFVRRVTKKPVYALLCAAFYLTGDLLFIRGWLAYSDPLLSLFIFSSIAFLWLGVEEKRYSFFIMGVIAVSLAFLTKALSPYWFYGLAGLVFLILHPNRYFLVKMTSLAIHFLALSFPLAWDYFSGNRYLSVMWSEVINTSFFLSVGRYFYQLLFEQPFLLLLRLAPISGIALFYYFKIVKKQSATECRDFARLALGVALLNFFVCWLAPRWPESRYYMPVFPFMSMCMAYVIWNVRLCSEKVVVFSLGCVLVLKTLSVIYFYYRYAHFELNNVETAKDIIKLVKTAPIYSDIYTNQSAPIEKVAIYLDLMRYPQLPVSAVFNINRKIDFVEKGVFSNRCSNCYVIGQIPRVHDRMIKQYSKGKHRVCLFYRSS